MAEVRPRHREFLGNLHEQGILRMAGSWAEPRPGAYIWVEADSAEHALEILDADPFKKEGVIIDRYPHPINVVVKSAGVVYLPFR